MDEIKNNLPKRKHPRLKQYDYSRNGSYFVTICTKGNECILSSVKTDENNLSPPSIVLSPIGRVAEKYICRINDVYGNVAVDRFVIMPNHIHLLITIAHPYDISISEDQKKYPTLQTIVRSFKRMVTREICDSVWQDSFFESILENDASYYDVYAYIENNPVNWIADKYYR